MVGRALPSLVTAMTMLALLGYGHLVWNTVAFAVRAARVEGVIAVAAPHPVIRFTPCRGKVVEFRQNGDTPGPAGTHVPVVYDPVDPAGTARVATVWGLWGTSLRLLPVAAAAACALVLAGTALIRR